jgi:host factor-I protein
LAGLTVCRNGITKIRVLGLDKQALHRHIGCIKLKSAETAARKEAKLMAADKQNLQDAFLNNVRKSKISVTIFLVNGVKLQGVITWFDNFCVLLRRDGQSQLVYKHAISTIMPSQALVLYDGEEDS